MKIPSSYLEQSVSGPLTNGMVLCIRRTMLAECLPFPPSNGAHDQWLCFCSLLLDGCYFCNEKLTQYRMHDDNLTANRAKGYAKILRIIRSIKYSKMELNSLPLGIAFEKKLLKYKLSDSSAYQTAHRLIEIGNKKNASWRAGGIAGGWRLFRLYCTDTRYRRTGAASFFSDLLAVILHREKEI